ncbi:hypothetical protein NC652_003375 [Populus alba x Populus x berolinensis]|nr:hypothetical protein NC652_003375 [Populus alba x Populus x berolinensis]
MLSFRLNPTFCHALLEAHRSTIFTTTKNRERNRERKNRKEMDAIDSVFDPLREFSKDSVRLVKRCHKPDRKEFTKVAFRTAIGFVVMGFVDQISPRSRLNEWIAWMDPGLIAKCRDRWQCGEMEC